MRRLRLLQHKLAVDIYAQSRPDRHLNAAVFKDKVLRILHIVQHALADVVMYADALLLYRRVIAGRVHIQAGRQRYRPEGTVRCERHVISLGHCRYLFHLGESSGVAQIRLDYVHAACLQQTLEVPAAAEALARRYRDIAGGGDLREALHVLAQHRLLYEHRVELLQLFGKHLRHRPVYPPVKIYRNAKTLSAALPYARDALEHGVYLIIGIDELQLLRRVHLDGPEALVLLLLRGSRNVRRPVAADPGIYADGIPAGASHELVCRNAEHLALDVPERLVDAGYRAHQHRAAAIKSGAVKRTPYVLDTRGIPPDEILAHLLCACLDRPAVSLEHRFAPSGYPLVGTHFQKAPSRAHKI